MSCRLFGSSKRKNDTFGQRVSRNTDEDQKTLTKRNNCKQPVLSFLKRTPACCDSR